MKIREREQWHALKTAVPAADEFEVGIKDTICGVWGLLLVQFDSSQPHCTPMSPSGYKRLFQPSLDNVSFNT
ncbi:MAG: hypothetical protein KAR37_16400, partial [Alphaproteobacteria bacterium]|nr:hypothetical protein [Alphaproteobacteria bacterium]